MSRIQRAQAAMRDDGVDLLLLGPGSDLRYLIGYDAPALERLTLLILPAGGDVALVVPQLEAPRAVASGLPADVEVVSWQEHENPYALVADRLDAMVATPPRRVAVSDRLWAMFTLNLQRSLSADEWLAAGQVLRRLRMRKDASEVVALREVASAIDAVHERVPSLLRPGRTETEVARDIADLILEDHDEVNFIIVAAGPNGASPHHETGERRLEVGDAVVVDIGGTRNDYCSDMTRNYTIGSAPDGYGELHAVLLSAQQAAVAAVRPGVTAESVDAAARSLLEEAGYGDYFIHRTGHGIGVEAHEDPYIVAGNRETLRPGMTFSIEPGIYIPERYGARIEDIVVVTDDGVERLNTLSRELIEVKP